MRKPRVTSKILLFCLLSIFSSCKNEHSKVRKLDNVDFPYTANVKSIPLKIDFSKGEVMDLFLYKNYIGFYGYDGNKLIHLFDKKNGEKAYSLISIGRGPAEFLGGSADVSVKKDTLIVYSNESSTVFKYWSDSGLSKSLPDIVKSVNDRRKFIYRPVNDIYLAMGSVKRFSLLDNNSNEIYSKTILPNYKVYKDTSIIKNIIFANQKLAVNENCNMFAVAHSFGAVLEIFQVKNNTISLLCQKTFYEPRVDVIGNYKQVVFKP